jgi:predicted nucleic acid-binding protein
VARSEPPLSGAVVDTNVVAYYILGTAPFRDECATFLRRERDLCAPTSWEAELVNVVWLAVRHGVFDAAEGMERLRLATGLGIRGVAPAKLWQGALARAVVHEHPAYDTLFVELAVRENRPLVTFDARLLALFPEVAHRPGAVTSRPRR